MSYSHHRRQVLSAGAASALSLLWPWSASKAAAYPSNPIRLVVPFPPGGPTDIVARPLAQLLSDIVKQQVIVDNRGGAGGSIGADNVATSSADGYTLLMATVGTNAINQSLYKKLPYDAVTSFTPVASVASAPISVVVHPSSGFTSLQDLVSKARAKPGTIPFGSAGNGTPGHLTGAMFCTAAGIELMHVPYKGSAPAITDLLGGQIPVMFDPVQSVLPHVQTGKLRALAVSSRERSPVWPDVPTIAESGYAGFEATAWWAVFGPAGMPPEATEALQAAIDKILHSEPYIKQLASIGVSPMRVPLGSFQKEEIAKWGKVVQQIGLVMD
ncbi:tripartite tricarboxylate transporter substrate binding protein [Allopusillimonas soli]|uniref:Tripartite tricarboxylate transporter substrate binding protein n=1 Tax=Allopusillimonas soli TaxID=659016 RepID=A0A853FD11_9BURK|nr:tripartite tricarboxylate transporter substrate binding protein [Allopusillimonas soli]NYT36750.1 tripartite tricarboxylate transporter substrate binding protein [Allopusillimonas soli]TEA75225.1 tripartite tricarboxylate transporter substrate binding protein [Allopusillimonas soli]